MVSWDTDAALQEDRDISGMVHDAEGDHPGVGTLASGYDYDGDLTNHLVGWWPLSWGNTRDLSGNGNHLTNNGAATGVSGRMGMRGYSFDGSNDYLSTAGFIDWENYSEITWGAWVKLNNKSSNHRIFSHNEDSGFAEATLHYSSATDEFIQHVSDGSTVQSVASSVTPSADTWYHVVGRKVENDALYITVNGTTDSVPFGTQGSGTTNDIAIGRLQRTADGYIDGTICDARVYTSALTDAQIQTLYEWGTADLAQPPDNNDNGVSYYNFNSANANDQWGTNDGTVNGATHQASSGPRGDGAYSFDGTDDFISTTADGNFGTDPFTVSLWYTLDAFDESNNDLLNTYDGSDGWILGIESGTPDEYRFFVNGDPDLRVDGIPPTNSWTNIVGVVTTDEAILYENGNRIGSAARGNTSVDSTQDIRLGNRSGSANWFDGVMDEIRVYDRALSPSEVQEIYRYGTFGIDMNKKVVNY